MSTKSVYSIRIPSKFRKIMDQMEDVNWQEEIREVTLKLIKEKNKKKTPERIWGDKEGYED